MHTHGPKCLAGPVSGTRSWWQARPARPELRRSRPRRSPPFRAREESEETFRADLVARVRKQIGAGTYDTPEKWEAALDQLLARLEAR
jgi:hypothetical protein